MPKLSGIETLREIRKIDGEIPVIIITGYGTEKNEKEALQYAVKKPVGMGFNNGEAFGSGLSRVSGASRFPLDMQLNISYISINPKEDSYQNIFLHHDLPSF